MIYCKKCVGCGKEFKPNKKNTKKFCSSSCCNKFRYHKDIIKTRKINNKRAKLWRDKNPLIEKAHKLKQRFGITLEEYNKIFSSQGGCCKICGTHQKDFEKSLFVDHNHKTGKIRGLLCSRCNAAIGMMKENCDWLKNAIDYLNLFI